jgi:hypothetical protein
MTGNEPQQTAGVRAAIPAVLLTGGIVLILLSFVWPRGAVSHANWSPEQAKQYQDAAVKLHGLSHASVHPSPDADPQTKRKELQQAEADYKTIRTQLDSAIDGPKHFARTIGGVGILLVLAGGFGMYYLRAPNKA